MMPIIQNAQGSKDIQEFEPLQPDPSGQRLVGLENRPDNMPDEKQLKVMSDLKSKIEEQDQLINKIYAKRGVTAGFNQMFTEYQSEKANRLRKQAHGDKSESDSSLSKKADIIDYLNTARSQGVLSNEDFNKMIAEVK